jgi:hypothetical protein
MGGLKCGGGGTKAKLAQQDNHLSFFGALM